MSKKKLDSINRNIKEAKSKGKFRKESISREIKKIDDVDLEKI